MNHRSTMGLAAASLLAAAGALANEWTGVESEDWFDFSNWTNGVPNAGINSVRINTDDPNPAVIDGDAAETGSSFSVGHTSRGELSILNGGSLQSGTSSVLGSQSAGNGSVTISGAGSSWQAASAAIGGSGFGELNILAGGRWEVLSGTTSIGQAASGTGRLSVSGAGSSAEFSGPFWLGHTGSGEMSISNGGQVLFTTTSTLGQAGNSQGELLLTGAGSLLSGNRLHVGNSNNGIMRLADGALLQLTGPGLPANYLLVVGANSGSDGEMVVGGPSGEPPESPGQMELDGGILFNGGAGTLVFNHSGVLNLPFPIEGPLGANASGHIQVENGVTLFSGQPLEYSGSLMIEEGTIFGAGGQLGDVINKGRLVASPGQSATLSIDGDYSHGDNAVLEVQFAPGPVLDRVEISGEASFSGGTIHLSVLPGNYGNTPLDGVYPILTASGGISGDLPQLEADGSNAFVLFREDDTLYVEVFDQMMRDRFEE